MSAPYETSFLEALQAVGLQPIVDLEKEAAETGVTSQNIWRHPDAHPVVLDYLLLQKYGPDWMNWESEVLEVVVPKDFETQTLSDLNMSKIQACKTLHLVDSFWERWEVFVWCTMAFNGVFPDFQVMQVPTAAQSLVAVDIASRLRNDIKFSSEVEGFLGEAFRFDGVLIPQPPLGTLKIEVDIDHAVLDKARERWKFVRPSKVPPKGDTMEDEQLRRMLICYNFLEESQQRLRNQLRLVHAKAL